MRIRNNLILVFLSISAVMGQNAPAGFKPAPAEKYPSHQTIGKLKLAAVKYESDEETKAAFGKVNPNEYGVLPVLLVLDNQGGNLLLDRMEVKLQLDRAQVDPTPSQDLPYVIAPKNPSTGPKYPNPLPISIKKKNPMAAIEFDSRKFAAKNVMSGEEAFGFFYFQARYRKNAVLYVTGIREAATGKEVFYAEIPIDTPVAP